MCFGLGFCFGHGFGFGCADFSAFFFCSSSLVLMGTARLSSDFYGFDGGCGCVLVVVVVVVYWWLNKILFYCSIYIILLC